MMARSQICLEPELQQKARRRAAQLGVSFAEYVRRVASFDDDFAVFRFGPGRRQAFQVVR